MNKSIVTQLKKNQVSLIKDIADKESLIKNLKIEIEQFEDAINLILKPTKYPVAAGALPPLEALKEVQNRAVNESERQSQLEDAKSALSLSLESLDNLILEKSSLQNELSKVENEIIWHSKYMPLVPIYQHEFTAYADELNKQLSMCENDLRGYQDKQTKILSFISGNPNRYMLRDLYAGSLPLDRWLDRLTNDVIPQLQRKIEELKNTELPALENDAKFRQWLVARVKINEPLQALINAQNMYNSALNELSNFETECNSVLNFKLYELPRFNKIVGSDFKLKNV